MFFYAGFNSLQNKKQSFEFHNFVLQVMVAQILEKR